MHENPNQPKEDDAILGGNALDLTGLFSAKSERLYLRRDCLPFSEALAQSNS